MNKIDRAEIISVGTELLLGDIVNTDAAYLSRELAALGISVYRQSVVGDNRTRILAELDSSFSRCDTVFLTGGLGPTCDDITRECVAEYFRLELKYDDDVMEHIRQYMSSLNRRTVTANNTRQAMVPEGADVFINSVGTAPALAVHGLGRDSREKLAILMPGPPSEFERMTEEHIIPYLSHRTGKTLVSRNICMYGIGESAAEELLRDFMNSENPTVAPYCETGEVRIRVTAAADDAAHASALCDKTVEDIRNTEAGRYIYAVRDKAVPDGGCSVARTLTESLKAHGKTVAFAESCTAGLVSKLVADVAGASAVLKGSAVTYATASKAAVLGVSDEVLESFGPISEECAAEMASGALTLYGADIAVSVTGVAGPDDYGDIPCGHVCFGVAVLTDGIIKTRTCTVEFGRRRSRQTVRNLAAIRALHEALSEVEKLTLI